MDPDRKTWVVTYLSCHDCTATPIPWSPDWWIWIGNKLHIIHVQRNPLLSEFYLPYWSDRPFVSSSAMQDKQWSWVDWESVIFSPKKVALAQPQMHYQKLQGLINMGPISLLRWLLLYNCFLLQCSCLWRDISTWRCYDHPKERWDLWQHQPHLTIFQNSRCRYSLRPLYDTDRLSE